jgi:hypothetical protein
MEPGISRRPGAAARQPDDKAGRQAAESCLAAPGRLTALAAAGRRRRGRIRRAGDRVARRFSRLPSCTAKLIMVVPVDAIPSPDVPADSPGIRQPGDGERPYPDDRSGGSASR